VFNTFNVLILIHSNSISSVKVLLLIFLYMIGIDLLKIEKESDLACNEKK